MYKTILHFHASLSEHLIFFIFGEAKIIDFGIFFSEITRNVPFNHSKIDIVGIDNWCPAQMRKTKDL